MFPSANEIYGGLSNISTFRSDCPLLDFPDFFRDFTSAIEGFSFSILCFVC